MRAAPRSIQTVAGMAMAVEGAFMRAILALVSGRAIHREVAPFWGHPLAGSGCRSAFIARTRHLRVGPGPTHHGSRIAQAGHAGAAAAVMAPGPERVGLANPARLKRSDADRTS